MSKINYRELFVPALTHPMRQGEPGFNIWYAATQAMVDQGILLEGLGRIQRMAMRRYLGENRGPFFSPEELIEDAKDAWELESIPPVPDDLFEVLIRGYQHGLKGLVPIYYSNINPSTINRAPLVIPKIWSHQEKKLLPLPEELTTLSKGWALFDATPQINNITGQKFYPNDEIIPLIIENLRATGQIDHSDESRFGLLPKDITELVLPKIASFLNIESGRVQMPSILQSLAAAQLYFLDVQRYGTYEWYGDMLKDGSHLLFSKEFSGIQIRSMKETSAELGFRFQILFPS